MLLYVTINGDWGNVAPIELEMRNAKFLSLAHLFVLLALIYWNYYSNTGVINGNTVGSISDKFDSLFTPASYAFSIWGVIYLGLLVFAVNMIIVSYSSKRDAEFVLRAAPSLIIAHSCSGLWLYFWLQELTGLSVVLMLAVLASLTTVVLRLRMEMWDAPLKYIATVWWPIDLYFGWISVATISNIASYLNKVEWQGGLSEVTWTIIAISLGTILSMIMIFKRNMREFGVVVIWAFVAIAVRHWNTIPEIKWSALIAVSTIFVASSYHAYKNRKTLPIIRNHLASQA